MSGYNLVASSWQVLLAMAEELGKFVPYVGGPPHAHTLLVPLETLSTVEETVVREKAVLSLNAVAVALPEAHVAEEYIPLVKVLPSNRLSQTYQRHRAAATCCGALPAPQQGLCSATLPCGSVNLPRPACCFAEASHR